MEIKKNAIYRTKATRDSLKKKSSITVSLKWRSSWMRRKGWFILFDMFGNDNRTRPDTRIFSPLAVPGLCVTIGRYWYLFKRLTASTAGRCYRFEHIVTYSSGKVVAKSDLFRRSVAKENT